MFISMCVDVDSSDCTSLPLFVLVQLLQHASAPFITIYHPERLNGTCLLFCFLNACCTKTCAVLFLLLVYPAGLGGLPVLLGHYLFPKNWLEDAQQRHGMVLAHDVFTHTHTDTHTQRGHHYEQRFSNIAKVVKCCRALGARLMVHMPSSCNGLEVQAQSPVTSEDISRSLVEI